MHDGSTWGRGGMDRSTAAPSRATGPSTSARPSTDAARPGRDGDSAPGRPTAIEAELARIPSLEEWPGLDAREHERRARVLSDIRQRVAEHGPHRAVAAPDRGRLFMPFAALKGYDDLVKDVEEE